MKNNKTKINAKFSGVLLACCMAFSMVPTVAFATEGDVAINATNFPDATFRTYVVNEFDSNSDNFLSSTEIAYGTVINVEQKSISDLTGIEHFTALDALYCYENELTNLDVSKNIALKTLWCQQNQLTSLDVSNNTALTLLWCHDNQLTNFDVSNNTALTDLDCSSNQLTTLDVSKNTVLETLACASNQLVSLDLSKNTVLENFSCYYNSFTYNTNDNFILLADLEIDPSKVSNVNGATLTDGKFIGLTSNEKITYDYDVEYNSEKVTFAIVPVMPTEETTTEVTTTEVTTTEETTTEPTTEESDTPKTGDSSNRMLYIILAILSLGGLGTVFCKRKAVK